MTHDHNCFHEAEQRAQQLEADTGKRCSHFLFIASDDLDDAHYLGNTAFAARVFRRLSGDVAKMHEYGKCEHCDRVAAALIAARAAFFRAMSGSTGRC